MQNHSGYIYEGKDFETTVHLLGDAEGRFPETEQYLTLIRESNQALKELLTYFEAYPEPIIVVMFGDHHPKLEDEFYEYVTGDSRENWDLMQQMQQYKTPLMIWHNYEAESKNIGNISLNYLASILLRDAGLNMSEYQRYILKQYEKFPVINSLGLIDTDGNIYMRGSEAYMEQTKDMQMLVYAHTVDKVL